MKNKRLLLTLLSLFLMLQLSAAYLYVINSESRTLSRIDTETNEVNNNFAQLGLTANLMDLDADHIWVVCSGDNAILNSTVTPAAKSATSMWKPLQIPMTSSK